MATNRTIEVGGVWANGAADVPGSPISETTYRKSDLSEAEIEAGWPYAKIVNSADLNEMMLRITTLLTSLEQWGVLPWSALTTYAAGAWCLGSDNSIYQSLADANTNHDPTASPTWWKSLPIVYAGRVTAAGAFAAGPSGWSVSKQSTGVYRITHAFGVDTYSVVAIPKTESGYDLGCAYNNITTGYFDIQTYFGQENYGKNMRDAEFCFMVTKL